MTGAPNSLNNVFFKPVGEWSGRLILPEARLEDGAVHFEVHNAPLAYSHLKGQTIELGWNLTIPAVKSYVDFVTTDLVFGTEAIQSAAVAGRIHPQRLNGWKKVGPLESLAGARPTDTLTIVLDPEDRQWHVVPDRNLLKITKPPVQVRGQQKCLAKFLAKARQDDKATWYTIQHYNAVSKMFDGPTETVCIPTFPKNNRGLSTSTTAKDIDKSPVNGWGWYLYGHFADGNFVVEAWEPRQALMVANLNAVVQGKDASLDAIHNLIWKGARYKKGKVETFLLNPKSKTMSGKEQDSDQEEEETPSSLDDDDTSILSDWKEGDRFMVIHLFGGIGGSLVNEENFLGIIPGHFALGNATIVRSEFTALPEFQIIHRQIYAHNNGGIVSGPNLWSSYCGDLERGWFGTRPISDIIVKLDAVTHTYEFDNGNGKHTVCPLDELIRELNEMGARYRTGDGDGSALVSSAHSCVQDSNQALYAALQETHQKLMSVQTWKLNHPDHPQLQEMAQLKALHQALDDYATPFGVRKDWAETAKGLKGTETQTALISLVETIRTWRTVVPRRAHDRLAEILLDQGAQLWFIRTNQIGGMDPDIYPLAPARAFDYHDNQKDPVKERERNGDQKVEGSGLCCCG